MHKIKLKSKRTLRDNLRLYFYVNSTNLLSYFIEQIVFLLFSWVPGIVGIALRAISYKMLFHSSGLQIIEEGVSVKRSKNIYLEKGVYVGKNSYLWGTPEGLYIGPHTRIMHNAYINVNNYSAFTVKNEGLIYVSKIEIGAYSVIGAFACLLGYGHICIGNYVIISNHCTILGYNHITQKKDMLIMDQGVRKYQTIIEDDVWVGAHSVILPGVKIGKGSVIGAGSVVTKDIKPYTIAVGNPAKVIKER